MSCAQPQLMSFTLSACHPKCFVPLCHTVYLAWIMIPSSSLVLKSCLSTHLSQQDLHTTVPMLTATTRLLPDLPDHLSPFFGCFSLNFSPDSCASQKTSGATPPPYRILTAGYESFAQTVTMKFWINDESMLHNKMHNKMDSLMHSTKQNIMHNTIKNIIQNLMHKIMYNTMYNMMYNMALYDT